MTQKKVSNIETRTFKAQELRADGESRRVEGYAAVFGSESENLGWFTEEIAPGAFDDVMRDDVRALYNHDENLILARTRSGTLELSLDGKGLRYAFEAPNTTAGNDLLESIRRGDITQSSFGFRVKEDKWENKDVEENGNKMTKTKRTIVKLERLYDVSPVTFPAYPDTEVARRSMEAATKQEEKPDLSGYFDTLEKISKLKNK
jgi:HK97 family phage prohead protease